MITGKYNMTLDTFHNNDDQQVPDTRFDVVATRSTSGGTVIKSNRLSSPAKPKLPDFNSLLQETQGNSASLDTPDIINCSLDLGYPVVDHTSITDQISEGLMEKSTYWCAIDDLSLYDGLHDLDQKAKALDENTHPTAVRPTTLSLLPQALPPPTLASTNSVTTIPSPAFSTVPALSPVSQNQLTELSPSGSQGFSSGSEEETVIRERLYEDSSAEIDDVCRSLWIPKNPYHWSAEHVHKWATWALREHYNIERQFLPELLMDGTTLCMLTQDEFVRRSPDVGYYLFAELDWWKTVTSEEPVYTDLSSSTSSVISTIPTPVLSDLEMSQSTLSQINCEVHQQEQQQQQQYSFLNSLAMDEDSSLMTPMSDNGIDLAGIKLEKMTDEVSMSEDEEEEGTDDQQNVHGNTRRYVSHSKHTIHLWQFLKDLLLSPEFHGNCIKWIDRSKGIFKIENSAEVAKLWGKRKNRPAMNYDKLSRSIRQYYKKGIIKKTSQSKRLVYQFQPSYL